MEIALGALLGVGASLVAWMVVAHFLRPSVKLSSFVSRTRTASGALSYRVRIQNTRRRRTAVDVRARVYLWVPDGFDERPGTARIIDVPCTNCDIIGLQPRNVLNLRLSSPGKNSIVPDSADWLDAALRAQRARPAELRVWIGFSDGYSGVRRAELVRYDAGDVHDNFFSKGGLGPGRADTAAEAAAS